MSKLHQIFVDLSTDLGSAVPNLIIQVPHMQPGAAGKTADLFSDPPGLDPSHKR